MNYTHIMFQWFTQNPFTAASVIFGGAVVAVTLYTYLYDYAALANRD